MGWAARAKVWVEVDGRLVMSDYRLRLLELVADTGSLARAASDLGLSYRRAWGKVKELEANLGMALVESETGGARGGRTTLSTEGLELVAAYRAFRSDVEVAVEEAFGRRLGELMGQAQRKG